MDAATETTVRIPAELATELADLATNMRREVPWVVAQALRDYIEANAELVGVIAERLREVESGQGTFIEHEAIEAWLDSLDTNPEQVPVAAP